MMLGLTGTLPIKLNCYQLAQSECTSRIRSRHIAHTDGTRAADRNGNPAAPSARSSLKLLKRLPVLGTVALTSVPYQAGQRHKGGDHETAVDIGSQPRRVMQPSAWTSFT